MTNLIYRDMEEGKKCENFLHQIFFLIDTNMFTEYIILGAFLSGQSDRIVIPFGP